jgi:hypothetical protein
MRIERHQYSLLLPSCLSDRVRYYVCHYQMGYTGAYYESTDIEASRTCLVKCVQDTAGYFLLLRIGFESPRFERRIQA